MVFVFKFCHVFKNFWNSKVSVSQEMMAKLQSENFIVIFHSEFFKFQYFKATSKT